MRVAIGYGALLLGLLAAAAAQAQAVQVSGAWARATAPGQDQGAVYLTLTAPVADRLLRVSSTDAAAAMLHNTTEMAGMAGMSSMADMDGLDLPAGQAVKLAPHGMHIMLMNLKHGLTSGGHVALELTFAKAGTLHTEVPVVPITAAGPQG